MKIIKDFTKEFKRFVKEFKKLNTVDKITIILGSLVCLGCPLLLLIAIL